MLRRVFSIASGLSLLLCLATVVLWARSYWVADSWDWDIAGTRVSVGSVRGVVWWDRIRFTPASQARYSRGPGYHRQMVGGGRGNVAGPGWSFAGFRWVDSHMNLRPGAITIVIQGLRIPDWGLVLASLILPGAWLIRSRSRRRNPPGLCRRCGYDLRATPDRCPECGTPAVVG